METPISTRRVPTHYFTIVSRKIEDSGKNMSVSKSRGQQWDSSALIDITNDSPIVGLANGVILDTLLAKQSGSRMKNTPGSGEDLLRGQVKTLLLKVEEEVEVTKFSLESSELFAPMPVNESQNQNISSLASVTPSVVSQQPLVPQVVNQEKFESEKSVISRSLLPDFSDKSPDSNASEECFSDDDDDDDSIWSMQANTSIHDEDKEDYMENIEGGMIVDELCEGLNKINMNEGIGPKFEGKHTRFIYDSDDEIVKEEVEENCAQNDSSPNILCLKGLPTPKGKHLRFCDDDDEKEEESSVL